jgi:hypothetical protein
MTVVQGESITEAEVPDWGWDSMGRFSRSTTSAYIPPLPVTNATRRMRWFKRLAGFIAWLAGALVAHGFGVAVGVGPVGNQIVDGWFTAVFLCVPRTAAFCMLAKRPMIMLANAAIVLQWATVLAWAGVGDSAVVTKWWLAPVLGVAAVIIIGAIEQGRFPRRQGHPLVVGGERIKRVHTHSWKHRWMPRIILAIVVVAPVSILALTISDSGRDGAYLRERAAVFRPPPGVHEVGRTETGSRFCMVTCRGADPVVRIYFAFDPTNHNPMSTLHAAVTAQVGAIGPNCEFGECARFQWRRWIQSFARAPQGYVVVGVEDMTCARSGYGDSYGIDIAGPVAWIDFAQPLYPQEGYRVVRERECDLSQTFGI